MERPEWVLSDTAKADLLDIAVYTVETWGEAQGDVYIEGLYEHLDRLCDFPRKGQVVDEAALNFRTTRYRSHTIFYQWVDQTLTIIRILHTAQDPDAAFPPPSP